MDFLVYIADALDVGALADRDDVLRRSHGIYVVIDRPILGDDSMRRPGDPHGDFVAIDRLARIVCSSHANARVALTFISKRQLQPSRRGSIPLYASRECGDDGDEQDGRPQSDNALIDHIHDG